MGIQEIPDSQKKSDHVTSTARAVLTLAALGVVFGDIGTSPLYALRECFSGSSGLAVTEGNVLGTVSLIIWFLIIIVSVKYVVFVMRADNKGEGGILALMALVHRMGPEKKRIMAMLPFFGILGAALLFSNSVITPAITVLSAIEGVSVAAPMFSDLVIPISIAILTGLFLIQFYGTSKIGSLFGPVLLIWFLTIGVVGFCTIIKSPSILYAFNPMYAVLMLKVIGFKCFPVLGAAFLAVTGAEVLYADMGHFSKKPIRIAWFYIVFPALILNYLGQGAKLLMVGFLPDNLFYSLSPSWFLIPLLFIATFATVVASQAVISAAFSLLRQAVQLGFWPRVRVVHTSGANIGQVYIPFVNIALYVITVFLILIFKESGNLASAYGITIAATMLLTTIMILLIARSLWKVTLPVLIPVAALFIAIDLGLLAANMTKFISGGWIVVVIAAGVSILMSTWVAGRKILQRNIFAESVTFQDFSRSIASPDIVRTKKIAVFLSANTSYVPRALLHNFKHNEIIHETSLIVCVKNEEVPFVNKGEKFEFTDFGNGIYRLILRYGFMEGPNIPSDILCVPLTIQKDPLQYSYFLGKESLVLTKKGNMAHWRKLVFLLMTRNAQSASDFFNVPPNRVVELGVQIEF